MNINTVVCRNRRCFNE